ncbi:MAG TPA: ABC transporter substrate-binding protein [Candidatus Limnocylindrales bacterium]|nr:ABC transporter substrate-binding protein [Candidatus Limnocylindrales bacterium]
MFRSKTGIRIAGLAVAVTLLAGACGGGASTTPGTTDGPDGSGSATKTINIGIGGPFTGTSALTGTEMKNAAEMAFEAINWQVGEYKINPVYVDDQADPAKGTAALEQAIVGQELVAGILNWNSSVSVAEMELTAKYKIPWFFGMGAAGTVNEKFTGDREKYGYWTTKGWPDPVKLTTAYVGAINDAIDAGTYTPESKVVAIYGEDTDWGRSFGAGLKNDFEASGWTIKSEDYFPLTQTDFSALMAKYDSDDVPVIAGTSTAAASITAFIKAYGESGLKSLVIADGLGWFGDWYEMTGPASDYVLDSVPGFATEKAKQFAADYKAKYGKDPSAAASGLTYDWTNFFIKLLQQTLEDQGSLTSETIYKQAQDKLWTGELTYTDGIIMSSYDFNAESIPDPVVGKGHYIFPVTQYSGGEQTVVWPADQASGELKGKP